MSRQTPLDRAAIAVRSASAFARRSGTVSRRGFCAATNGKRASAGSWADGGGGLADRALAILDRGDPLATNELAITGNDLMSKLGMKPGPEIGKTLRRLFEQVLDDPSLNAADALFRIASATVGP